MSVLVDGYLEKRRGSSSALGRLLTGEWQRRWFTLTAETLSYSHTLRDKVPRHRFPLVELQDTSHTSHSTLQLRFASRCLELRAADGFEMRRWLDAVEVAQRRMLTRPVHSLTSPLIPPPSPTGRPASVQVRRSPMQARAALTYGLDFDRASSASASASTSLPLDQQPSSSLQWRRPSSARARLITPVAATSPSPSSSPTPHYASPPLLRGAATEALSDSDDDEDELRISPMPGTGPSPATSPTELVLDSPAAATRVAPRRKHPGARRAPKPEDALKTPVVKSPPGAQGLLPLRVRLGRPLSAPAGPRSPSERIETLRLSAERSPWEQQPQQQPQQQQRQRRPSGSPAPPPATIPPPPPPEEEEKEEEEGSSPPPPPPPPESPEVVHTPGVKMDARWVEEDWDANDSPPPPTRRSLCA